MVAEICKQVNNKSVVVVGGYHPTAVASDFVYQKSPFDFIVKGEGEEALLAICRGKIKKDNERKIIQGIPLDLAASGFSLSHGTLGFITKNKSACIYLSRGCPFLCNFCMERAKRHGVWRSYSVDQAVTIIRRLSDDHDVERINITDACFGYNKHWRREFLSKLIKSKIKREFWAETRIDLIDREDVDLLSKLNFRIDFGVESCSATMLRIMGKTKNPKMYLKKCEEVTGYMNKKGARYSLFFIFNHPGETCHTYIETLRFIDSLIIKHKTISGVVGVQDFAFFPGSHVHTHLNHYKKEYGTVVKHRQWWKEKGPHEELARSVIASRSLMLKFGETKTYWREGMAAIVEKVIKKNKSLLSLVRSRDYSLGDFVCHWIKLA